MAVNDKHRLKAFRSAAEFDDDAEPVFHRLTAAEADALRARNTWLSPWRVVGGQAIAGLICSAVFGLVWGETRIAWSALYGAAVAVLPSALLARGMTRGSRGAVASATGFMFWESLKIGVAVAMLAVAVKAVPQLSWPALLATMVVCIKINWLALLWRGR